ncbi:putative type-1 restriction enzyme specificity protein, partial [Orchesella cincta]
MSSTPRSPLDLCPIEVWKKIFVFLNGRDLLSCFKTAESWRRELLGQKNELLMADVFPLLSQYMEKNDILNIRLGCRLWKEAIDDFVQNHPSRYNVVWSSALVEEVVNWRVGQYANDWFPRNLEFNSSFDRKRCANFLRPLPEGCSPFLSRSIFYSDSSYFLDDRVIFTQILERFGSHIWHFQLHMEITKDGNKMNATANYNMTRSWLLLMPNLKSLSLHFWVSGFHRFDKSEYLMTPEKKELIINLPLPPLKDLLTLKLHSVIHPLEYALFHQYSHIQKLSIRGQTYQPLFQDSVGIIVMDRLEELNIDPQVLEDFTQLQNMSLNSPWPLRTLSVTYHEGFQDHSWEPMFRAISHFGATLSHLGLEVTCRNYSTLTLAERFNSNGASLELPHVETFKLFTNYGEKGFFSSLNFLQPCVSLRILEVTRLNQYSISSLAPLLSLPLATLRLELCEDKDLWMVLRTVSHLGATLRHLKLSGEFYTSTTADNMRSHSYLSLDRLDCQFLALPLLETLCIRCGTLIVDSLDFTQRCISLRKLVLRALHTPRIPVKDFHQVIQFRGYFHKMNESNIWNILPGLRVFELNMKANAPIWSYEYTEPVPDGFVQDWGWINRTYTRTTFTDILPPPDPSDGDFY